MATSIVTSPADPDLIRMSETNAGPSVVLPGESSVARAGIADGWPANACGIPATSHIIASPMVDNRLIFLLQEPNPILLPLRG